MEKLLVSACLLGIRCRYDGKSVADDCLIGALSEHAELIPFCPEVYGGLPTPRPPAEIIEGRVIADTGRDVTGEYERGAREALAVCKRLSIRYALLKSRSPSCGKGVVYDGTFSGALTEGDGVCAGLLSENGISVFSSDQVQTLFDCLENAGTARKP